MGRKPTTDFVLDTKGLCFLCTDPVSSPLIKLGPGDPPDPTTVYDVQYLTMLLKLDMRKVFRDKSSIPPQLLAKVQNSKLRTNLCKDCLKLSEKFSELQRKLEKIKLEVDFCLGEIRQKLTEARNEDETVKIDDVSNREPNFAVDLLKLEVAEVLRSEAVNQCTAMLSCPFPRIRVQKMTEEEIGRGVLKNVSASGNTAAALNETASCSSIEFTTGGSHDMRLDISEVKPERNSPNLSPDTDERGDRMELNTYTSVTGDDSSDDSEPEQKYTTSATKSSTETVRWGKLRNKSKITTDDGHRKKNRDSFSGVIPPPVKIVGKMGTWQGQYIKTVETGQYNCRLCPKSYSAFTHFYTHFKSIHLKEKFRCGICKIEYSYKQQYELHFLNAHAGVRYQCGKCNQSFNQKSSLYRHNISAHLGRKFFCGVCSQSFTQSANLNLHMRKNHRDKFGSHKTVK